VTDLLHLAQHTIETHGLLDAGDGVVVGVSGGPDSLCLLHLLLRLQPAYRLTLHVAHLHHGARGPAADADAEFVAALAAAWHLPVTVERHDVPALACQHKLTFEEAARRVRYAFLAQVAVRVGASRIAVGHNADDQAETVLMHILRGSGLAGLRGMRPLTPLAEYRFLTPLTTETSLSPRADLDLIRPLLDIPRSEIESYCAAQGLEPRFDRSNLDTTYFRNRLRHDLLPLLQSYNPNIHTRLCHTAAVVAADYELLILLYDQAWSDTMIEEQKTAIRFDLDRWRALPVAAQRATLRRAIRRLRQDLRDVDFVHIEDGRHVALTGETGAQAILPRGLVLTVGYEQLTISDTAVVVPPLPADEPLLWNSAPLVVATPGVTLLPDSDWVLQADRVSGWNLPRITDNADPWIAYLDADACTAPFILRSRQPGDRFRPQGMGGHTVKLSAFMTNVKIPHAWRDHIPLLVAHSESGSDILWVCGHRVSETAAVTPDTERVMRMRFVRQPHASAVSSHN